MTKWGVLGAAGIAVNKVIPAIQRSETSRVVAIASRDGARARAAADRLGVERAYGSYDELLADNDVEIIYVPLPNHLHVPWTIRAAEAGKHVLCEKPIALSADQARELIDVRERTARVIAEAFMVRTHPQWLKVLELVRSGAIGELRLVSGHFSYYKVDPDNVRNRVEWGGGGLMDIGCYPVMISRWLFGREPVGVSAVIDRDPEMNVDRLTSALMDFGVGHGTFTVATQLTNYQRMQIFGTTGHIELEAPFNPPTDRPSHIVVNGERLEFGVVDQFGLQADAFVRAVRGEGQVPMTLEDSVKNMAVLDALASDRFPVCRLAPQTPI